MRRFAAAIVILVAAGGTPALGEEAPSAEAPRFAFRVVLSDLEPTRDRDLRKAELLYGSARAELTRNGFGARAEIRGTEGRFRAYYPGSVWLEEGYGFVATPLGELRVGKVPRAFGLEDATFSGNLFSLNGVSRNPDWGGALVGSRRFGYDELHWAIAYLGRNDHVAWEEDGRGVESDTAATLRDGLEIRASYLLYKGLVTLRPGFSAASARIVREAGAPEFRRDDLSVDGTATAGPIGLSLQGLARSGERAGPDNPRGRLGYDDARAWLLHFRAEFPTVLYRYTYSEWRYLGAAADERIHQPGVAWTPVKGIEATIEYIARRLRQPSGVTVSNAFRLGLALSF